MKIGGMSNPFLKPSGVNPFKQTGQVQKQENNEQTLQTQQQQNNGNQNKTQSVEDQDEKLKKFSDAWRSYGMAALAMNGAGKSGIGVETCGTMG
jgi:hypothetical protein